MGKVNELVKSGFWAGLAKMVAGDFPSTVAAAGSTQADATQIVHDGFVLVSAADATKGVKLPAAQPGDKITIKNNVNAILKVYPATGDAINALAANAAISMAALSSATFTAYDATTWYTNPTVPS